MTVSNVAFSPRQCPAHSADCQSLVQILRWVERSGYVLSCVAQFLSGSSHRNNMPALSAETILSYHPSGVAVDSSPKYLVTKGESRPQNSKCSFACRASSTASSNPRSNWARRVALQELCTRNVFTAPAFQGVNSVEDIVRVTAVTASRAASGEAKVVAVRSKIDGNEEYMASRRYLDGN